MQQHFPHHLHCYELFVCGSLKRAEMETLLPLPERCVSPPPPSPLSLSHFCVCVRVLAYVYACVRVSVCLCVCMCHEELWRTKLDSVGGVNSITIFFFAAHFGV